MKTLFVIISFVFTSFAYAAEGLVIVNSANSASADAIANHYLKKSKRWPSGAVVDSYGVDDPALRAGFAKSILDMSVADEDRHWVQFSYATGKKPAKFLQDPLKVLVLVALKPGGIGFVPAGQKLNKSVRVVTKFSY